MVVKSAPKKVGKVTHYYSKLKVAVIKILAPVRDGDKISIEGETTNFKMTVKSMQIKHKTVKLAKKGQAIGMKVRNKVREHDAVYKL